MIELLIFLAAMIFSIIYAWGFKNLPAARWQVFAAIPIRLLQDGKWEGVNLTFYGIFTATATALGTEVYFFLGGTLAIDICSLVYQLLLVLLVCIPSSKIMAYIVEKKINTITVGGASFIGFLLAPLIVMLGNHDPLGILSGDMPQTPILSILFIGYAFGEGFGRLACISFGCCYGKPTSQMPAWIRKVFNNASFIFSGKTKKLSYADHLDGIPLFPIQGITAVIFTSLGLFGMYLFLKGYYTASLFITLIGTQTWRFASEFFRADYRGGGAVSMYQVFSLITIPYYSIIIFLFAPTGGPMPDLRAGLRLLWNIEIMFIVFVIWLFVLLFTGISSVTGSRISIELKPSCGETENKNT